MLSKTKREERGNVREEEEWRGHYKSYRGRRPVARTNARTGAASFLEEKSAEGEARRFHADHEVWAGNAVGGAYEKEVGYGLGSATVRAEGGRCEFESMEVRVQPDVARAELGEDAALRPTESLVHFLRRFGGGRVVEGGDARVPGRL
jgi:hypothetical protein